jgi:hypothetical protein
VSAGQLGGETREEGSTVRHLEGWIGFVRVQCLQSHGGGGSGRDLNVQGSLEEERAAIIEIVFRKERWYELGSGKATGTMLGVTKNGVRVACS